MSASIIIHHDPEGMYERELLSVPAGTVLLDFLIDQYEITGFTTPTIMFKGDIHPDNEIDQTDFHSMNRILKDDDIINIVHRPQGVFEIVAAIVAVVLAVVLAPDISPPPAVENPNFPKTNESPNNRLTGQTNVARPLARIPDVYGSMRVYPDLGTKTVTEYFNQKKYVTEYLIVGRGTYAISELKSGETLIDDIVGADYVVYDPNVLIPELIDVTDSNEVNGQEIQGPNDQSFMSFSASLLNFSSVNSNIVSAAGDLSSFAGMNIGSKFTITNSALNDGTFTLKSYFSSGLPGSGGLGAFERQVVKVEETLVNETNSGQVSFAAADPPFILGPYVVPGGSEEIWLDILAPRGLADRRNGDNFRIKLDMTVTLEEISSTGSIISTEVFPISIADNTLDPRFYTFKFQPQNPGSKYQATLERITNTVNDSAFYDTVKWGRLGGVNKLIGFDQGDVTSVVLTTTATEQSVKSQQRKFNAIVTRKLRTYTTAGGVVIQTLTATNKFADAMLHHLTDPLIGNKAETDVDLDSLYAIQEALDVDPIYGSTLGQFAYSFSSDKSSVKDEILLIANACRVYIRKLGNTLTFGRDEIRPTRTTLFNTRTKRPGSERKTRRLQKPTGSDGVELQWVEADTGTPWTIVFPTDGSALNPKRIDAAGIRNYKQAWNRAKVEFLKLKLQRETVEFESTKEGLYSPVGDRVANADGTDVKAQSGEVKSISGFDVETYFPMDFDGNPDATVIMRDESGNTSADITVTPRLDGIEGFILGALPGFTIRIRGDLGYQVGTLYTFALTGEMKIKDYIIQQMTPKKNGYVKLKLTNYDPLIYGPDTETPPVDTGITVGQNSNSIILDAVSSAEIYPINHTVRNEGQIGETLAWNLAPTGTYVTSGLSEIAYLGITFSAAGTWTISGYGSATGIVTDSGDYRPGATGIDIDNFEIRITAATVGVGQVTMFGGLTLGVWKQISGGEGIEITDSDTGDTVSSITVEIREIAIPANTTTAATFTFDTNGQLVYNWGF